MVHEERPAHGRPRNRQSRGKGIRKTTGCITCRKRHLKCDETKPFCGRCLKGPYTCVYATANPRVVPMGQDENVPAAAAAALPSQNIEESPQWRNNQEQILHASPTAPESENYRPQNASEQTQQATKDRANDFIHRYSGLPAPVPTNQYATSPEALSVCAATGFSLGSNDNQSVESSFSQPSYNIAITKWFDLLAGDADLGTASAFDNLPDLRHLDGSLNNQDPSQTQLAGSAYETFPIARHHRTLSTTSSPQLLERTSPLYDAFRASEKQRWQAPEPLQLLPHEHLLFQNFVQHISHWIDLFDPSCNFSTFVPHLAMHNVGLMKAILTLSARHVSLNPDVVGGQTHDRNDALQYYNETLHYVSKAMQYDTYKTSLDLLATALIVSTFEMLDGSGMDWERHLQGVFWIQRSQVIHGDSKGLKQAVWWAWLCQDIWAAFREKRKTFTFWKPVRTYEDMNPHELAARSVYLIAQVINYCSREELEACEGNMMARIKEADRLATMLDDWHPYLTIEFSPLPLKDTSSTSVFKPIWIHPPAFGVALQLYNCAHLLLILNRPSRGGLAEYMGLVKLKKKFVANICGIAMTLNDYASSILSSQCLYIAGMCLQDMEQRKAVLNLLDSCRARTGWPIKSLGEELQRIWEESGD